MSTERYLSTNAFDAYKTDRGICIIENNLAYRKSGALTLIVGLLCMGFSFVAAEIPFKNFITVLNQLIET